MKEYCSVLYVWMGPGFHIEYFTVGGTDIHAVSFLGAIVLCNFASCMFRDLGACSPEVLELFRLDSDALDKASYSSQKIFKSYFHKLTIYVQYCHNLSQVSWDILLILGLPRLLSPVVPRILSIQLVPSEGNSLIP